MTSRSLVAIAGALCLTFLLAAASAYAAGGHFTLVVPAPLRDEAIVLGISPERVVWRPT